MKTKSESWATRGEFLIEIANRIKGGRAIGTDYVVTKRPSGKSAILSRHRTRKAAQAWIDAELARG